MTSNEIRSIVPPVAIAMADAAIRSARRAILHKTGWNDVRREDCLLPEVDTASNVLRKLFDTYDIAVRKALVKMPDEYDGVREPERETYFDVFVEELEYLLMRKQETVELVDY